MVVHYRSRARSLESVNADWVQHASWAVSRDAPPFVIVGMMALFGGIALVVLEYVTPSAGTSRLCQEVRAAREHCPENGRTLKNAGCPAALNPAHRARRN